MSLIVVFNNNQCECGVFSIIRDLLQWNVAGIPTIHQTFEYDFNPEVSQKRREQFYEVIINQSCLFLFQFANSNEFHALIVTFFFSTLFLPAPWLPRRKISRKNWTRY